MNVEIKIKNYLVDIGCTQAFVSKKANISASKLNLALNGKRKLRLDEYKKICDVLGVNFDRFLTPQLPSTITYSSTTRCGD